MSFPYVLQMLRGLHPKLFKTAKLVIIYLLPGVNKSSQEASTRDLSSFFLSKPPN